MTPSKVVLLLLVADLMFCIAGIAMASFERPKLSQWMFHAAWWCCGAMAGISYMLIAHAN